MDVSEVRVCSSLRWLAGMVAQGKADSPIRAVTLRDMLLDPYTQESELKGEVVALLTDPNLYMGAYDAIFPQDPEPLEGGTFWPLIHRLARLGVYLVEGNDAAVNHTALAQNNPFREASHLALLDGLMSVYASSTVTVERVVKAVRQLSAFNPSRELPCGVEDSLLLWLNKVSQAVCTKQKTETNVLLQDPDARQRRRNRLKLVGAGEALIPLAEDLCSGVASGQCLAALLVHYIPQMAKWSDFHFGGKLLSRAHCLQNLNKVRDLCNSNLPLPGFHLHPEELVSLSLSDALKKNIIALLSFLFACFEVKGLGKVSREGRVSSTVNGGVVANGVSQHRSSESSRDSLLRNRCYLTKEKRPLPSQFSHYSYSMNDIRPEHQLQNGGSRVPPQAGHLLQNLSSLSTSALVDRQRPVHASSTVFNAPVRSSLTVPQAAALAGFNKQMRFPGGHHQLKQELITASTENLHIREQMISERMSRAGSRKQKPVQYDASLSSSSNESSSLDVSTSGAADVSGNSTVSGHVGNLSSQSSPHPASGDVNPSATSEALNRSPTAPEDLPNAPLQYSSNHPKQSVQFYVGLKTSTHHEEVKRSFTISKHHTPASANAAGLPVISNKDSTGGSLIPSSLPSQPNPNQTFTSGKEGVSSEVLVSDPANPNKTPGLGTRADGMVSSHGRRSREVSSSASSISSAPTVLVLNLFPKPSMAERNKFRESKSSSSSVPPEILELRQKLEEKEAEIRKLQAMREKQLLLERQKFGQKAYLALMERTKALQNRTEVAASCLPLQTESKCHSMARPTNADYLRETPQQAISQQVTESSQVLHPTLSEPALPAIAAPPNVNPTGSLTNIEKAEHVTTRATPWTSHCSTGKKMLPGTSQPSFAQLPFSPIRPPMLGRDDENMHLGARNPWTTPLQQSGTNGGRNSEPPARKMPVHEDALKRRQEQVRARLEERQREMRSTIEQRRKEQARKTAIKELNETSVTEAVVECSEDSSTLHFKLSSQLNERHHHSSKDSSTSPQLMGAAAAADFLTHDGPECYVKPLAKSNKRLVRNALCHVCLAGEANMTVKQRALAELDASTAHHFLVLFRDTVGFKFRAFYSYSPNTDHITKVFGNGPKYIREHMVSHLYKYNSGSKEFKEILTKSFSISVDALTMKNNFWASKKSKPPLGVFR